MTKMFCDLVLPTANTAIYNAQVRLDSSVDMHKMSLIVKTVV